MAGSTRVIDPDGKAFTVRRRWFPWRRALSLTAIWYSTSGEEDDTSGGDAKPATAESGDSESSGNAAVHAIFVVLSATVWLIAQAGKVVLIVLAAIIVVVLSVADLVVQLVVMPFTLLARAAGVMRWPVQIDREKQHFRTVYARGFTAAAALRDELAARIQRGELEPDPSAPAP
ncbi:hypothetical protein [Mycobacterium riyadhense]|uniref:hypothetical protein n=1 Tax=Mycobacterium riyadhense TaxID=486698 RepID=UPI00195984A3|nr:hypothetical protein [Mycobacterium riyadhense]